MNMNGCTDGCRVSREVRRKNGVTAAIPLTRASPQEGRFNRDDTGRRNAVTVFEKFDYKKRPPMVGVSLCRVLRHLQWVDEKRRG